MSKCNDNGTCGNLVAPQRNNYFYGQLLDDDKLRREQRYLNQKRWMLNRLSLGKGVLCGLTVTWSEDRVCISPGVAIDGCGREIVVPDPIEIDPWQITDDRGRPSTPLPTGADDEVYCCLAYVECLTDATPVLVTDCDSTNGTAHSTIVEKYAVIVKEVGEGMPPPLPAALDANLCAALSDADTEPTPEDMRAAVCEVLSSRACAEGDSMPCVVIASKITLTAGKISAVDVCSARPVAYGNPELFEMLLCRGTGGGRGPKGEKGDKGDPGAGLESNLTRIVATSWEHAHFYAAFEDAFAPLVQRVHLEDGSYVTTTFGPGLVIAFSRPVKMLDFIVDGRFLFLFEVLGITGAEQLLTWNSVFGLLLPVTDFTCVGDRITGAVWEKEESVDFPAEVAGFAYFPLDKARKLLRNSAFVFVRVRGDLIIDTDGRAIDAAFARATLPTGSGPPGTGLGLQGGTFESWFSHTPEGIATGPNLTGRAVSLNNATAFELALVPGIGIVAAEAIIAERDTRRDKRFRKPEELLGLGGIDERRLSLLKSRINFE